MSSEPALGGPDIESGAIGDPGGPDAPAEESKGLRKVKETTVTEKVAGGVAIGAVGTSVTAMIIEQNPLVYVAGGLSSGIAPYAVYQQTKLTDIANLKETHEALKQEVDYLEAENERLSKSVNELGDTVGRLEDVENALDLITNTQNQSVNAFAEQVKENKSILDQMQTNLRANVLQNLLSVIIRSDKDKDFQIDESEMDSLISRMRSINGVEVHEDRFRNAIQKSGGSLNAVIDVVKNLLSDDVDTDNEIFTIHEDE